ncbi:thioredoxin domain-containing protein [soil metagenome]
MVRELGLVNRLGGASSPYLLQHAHNPVAWQPWDEEAIEAARRLNVPIFLSVGYSTCYWCHVMERESFEDAATAAVMNARFVNIKLDREERPDLDDIYMAAVQMMTGSGGWPMSVFLEARTLRPFYAGTYFPPRPAYGRPSFTQVLERVSAGYARDEKGVSAQAAAVAQEVERHLGGAEVETAALGVEDVQRAAATLLTIFDATHGGFGGAPKFPQAVCLEYLLELRAHADAETRVAVDRALRVTLNKMMVGGIHDQVGGGFHRYSVDGLWLVPHFEKMLYDQAQLLSVYARAAKVYGDEMYARTARRIVAFVQRELTAEDGTFFTALDAEVDGREGLSFLWDEGEMRAVLGEEDGAWAARVFHVGEGANFQDPHHPETAASNVLWLRERPEETAAREGVSVGDFVARLDEVCARLLMARDQRKQARRDDKVLTAWNGMMIGALARAGDDLAEKSWVEMAERAMEGLLKRHWVEDVGAESMKSLPGRRDACPTGAGAKVMMRVSRGAERAVVRGVLEDSAQVVAGLAALARQGDAGRRAVMLETAGRVLEQMEGVFGDGRGGVFDTREGAADLFVRARTTYDGALPSGVSVLVGALVELAEVTGTAAYARRAAEVLHSISGAVHAHPVSTAHATRALLRMLTGVPAGAVELVRLQGGEMATGNGELGRGDAELRKRARVVEGVDPVRVLAPLSEITLARGHPAAFTLRLEIDAGWHIGAFDAGAATGGVSEPLRVSLVNAQGLRVYAEYPKGERMAPSTAAAAADEKTNDVRAGSVHTGVIEFTVVVEVDEDAAKGAADAAAPKIARVGLVTEPEQVGSAERPARLVVTYQACAEDRCLAIRSRELQIDIHVLGDGDEVEDVLLN